MTAENSPKDDGVPSVEKMTGLYTSRTAIAGWILIVLWVVVMLLCNQLIDPAISFYAAFFVIIIALSLIFLKVTKKVINKTADEADIRLFRIYRGFTVAMIFVLLLTFILPLITGRKPVFTSTIFPDIPALKNVNQK